MGTSALPELVRQIADETQRTMREKVPFRTGRLRASIIKQVQPLEASVVPTAPYWPYVEFGTRPHEILPVRARALRFQVGGGIVFAARVWHPGTKPHPFVAETAEAVKEKIGEIWKKVFEEWVK